MNSILRTIEIFDEIGFDVIIRDDDLTSMIERLSFVHSTNGTLGRRKVFGKTQFLEVMYCHAVGERHL